MRNQFVLVPGACHGGWWYEPLAAALIEHGHAATPVTLRGLDPDDPGDAASIGLEDHVAQVHELARDLAEGPDPIVLVGHSYAGSVITGVADRLTGDVSALVYLDAFVPEDGDSCYSMTNDEQRRWYIEGAGETGLTVQPLPFFDARARPHPLGTFVQRSVLTGAWKSIAVKYYAAAMDWPGTSPFAPTTERLESDPDWTVQRWATRHNVMHDGPGRVLELLLDVAGALS